MKRFVTQSQARQLLHNKFVVVLGGSVHRSVYKDLVLLLQKDQYLTVSQLKSKGEFSFEQDRLVEGGRWGPMTNGTEYREVRQYRSSHHLLRFYFITRVYSSYMESILEDFRCGLKPDVIIVNSCIWDISRYGLECLPEYKANLHKFFGQIKATVCHDCLILWLLAMPLGKKIKGGFLVPEIHHIGPTLRYDVIEANFYSGRLADAYGLDVVDLHFHFRFSLHHRMPDGIHWDAVAHRRITSLLLQHAAQAWGVRLHASPSSPGQVFQTMFDTENFRHHSNRPLPSPPKPLLNSAFHRRSLVRDQENHISSAWFQCAPDSGVSYFFHSFTWQSDVSAHSAGPIDCNSTIITSHSEFDVCVTQQPGSSTGGSRTVPVALNLTSVTIAELLTIALRSQKSLVLLQLQVSPLLVTGCAEDSITTPYPPPTCGCGGVMTSEPAHHNVTPTLTQRTSGSTPFAVVGPTADRHIIQPEVFEVLRIPRTDQRIGVRHGGDVASGLTLTTNTFTR